MTRRERLIESTNHVGEAIGEYTPVVRSDVEDGLCEVLDETLRRGDLAPYRTWVRAWSRPLGMDEEYRARVLHDDTWAWLSVHTMVCSLRRMMARYEYSANVLLRWGMEPPQGTDELYL